MKQKVLLTGGAGFLGSYVKEDLEDHGYEVIVFDKKLETRNNLVYSNLSILREVDYVIHMAAEVGLQSCFKDPILAVNNNVLATTRLLEACKQNKNIKHIIVTSTWAVKGKLENPYDVTKLCAENMALSYAKLHGLPVTVFRLGTAFGNGMRENGVICSYIKAAKTGQPLQVQGRGEQIRQFTHAKDIAKAYRMGLDQAHKNKVYYIVSPEVVSINDLAKMFDKPIEYKEARACDEDYKVIESKDATNDFGWMSDISLKDGILEMENNLDYN